MITFMKRLAILMFILGCFFVSVHADDDDLTEFYNTLLPNFQKMTPEASALGQYGNYTASDYTGIPNISIPLFSVNSSGFTMPIELSYDASGIKVEQQATYVGLGWNLMMGGKISQIVCGQNDNWQTGYYVNTITNQDLLKPLSNKEYFSSLYGCFPTVEFPGIPLIPEMGTPLPIDTVKFQILQSVTNGAKVPDVYQASFCGHNVSFVIDPFNSKAKIIGNDATNYQIEIYKENVPYLLHRIEITDDHGLKYVFKEMPQYAADDNALYNLSKIENVAGHCLVEFRYFKEKIKLLKSYYESKGKIDSDYGKPIPLIDIRRKFIDRNYPLNSLVYETFEYYPDTIITQNEIVTFAYSDRDDVKEAKQLDKVTVKSNSDRTSTIHSVDFDYDYFTESSYESDLCSRYGYADAYSYKRLKLKGIAVDGKNYSFVYNSASLPTRLSLQQDFLGYHNGQYNKNDFCSSPKYKYNYNGTLDSVVAVGNANRFASASYCNSGILTRIVYPTGGYTQFNYELNHFDDVISRCYYPSAISNFKYTKIETCGSGYNGKGYKSVPDSCEFDVKQPVKVEISSSTPYLDRSSSSFNPSRPSYYSLYFSIVGIDSLGKKVFERYYTKYNDKQDFKETHELPKGHYIMTSQFGNVEKGLMIGGSIRVTFPPELREDKYIADASGKSVGGGLRIKEIENYDSNGAFLGSTKYKYEGGLLLIPTIQAELINMIYNVTTKNKGGELVYSNYGFSDCQFYFVTSHPTYPAICSLGSSNVGYSKVIKEYYDKDKKLMSYDVEKYHNKGYSICHNMFSVNSDGLNGKLIESATYSKDNVLMHKVNYLYTTIGKNPPMEDMVFFPWARCLDMSPGNSDINVRYKYSLYPKYPLCVLPQKVTEVNYVNGKPLVPITTYYEYKQSNYQAKSITKSNGYESTCTNIWYPIDSVFLNKANNALKTELKNKKYDPDMMLNSKHCISEKTIVEESRNGSLKGGYLNLYKELPNGLPVIDRCYSIQPSQTQILEMEVMDYDSYGNIREYRKKDGTPVSLVWSYNHQCPVMEIVGKGHNDFNNEILSLIANIEGKTNVLPSDIRNLYNSLTKQKYQGVSIKAYIYSPWHTVSSIIQPNGYETKYSYDSYGRLEKASDASDNILQKYIYNYKK